MVDGKWEFLPSDSLYCSSNGPTTTTTTTTTREITPPTPPTPPGPDDTTTTKEVTPPNDGVKPYSDWTIQGFKIKYQTGISNNIFSSLNRDLDWVQARDSKIRKS